MSQIVQNMIAILIVASCIGWMGYGIFNWLRGTNSGSGCASSGCGNCPSKTISEKNQTPQNVVPLDELMPRS